jgi:hypothetical protein
MVQVTFVEEKQTEQTSDTTDLFNQSTHLHRKTRTAAAGRCCIWVLHDKSTAL